VIDVAALFFGLLWICAAAVLLCVPVALALRAVAFVRARSTIPWARRVGDRERVAVARRLSGDYAAGRLDLDEHEARTERAFRAATYADLRAIAHDLPPARPLRAFRLADLGLAFVAGVAVVGVNPLVGVLVASGILLRRRLT
jgi:hypothetical protein